MRVGCARVGARPGSDRPRTEQSALLACISSVVKRRPSLTAPAGRAYFPRPSQLAGGFP